MSKKEIVICFLLIAALVLFFSSFASRLPDTLEKTAQEKKFLDKEKTLFNAPISGYTLAGIKNEKYAALLAGICGIAAVSYLSYLAALLLSKKKKL